MPCNDCEVLPEALPESGTLYISPPLTHTLGLLRKHLQETATAHTEPYSGVLCVPYAEGALQRMAVGIRQTLSQAEIADSKSLLLPPNRHPALHDLIQMQSLATLLSKIEGAWLVDMLREERLTTHFQPIVYSSQPEKIYAYECLLRGTRSDGSLISPQLIFEMARDSNLLFYLDRAARHSALRNAKAHGLSSRIFINFSPSSIYDPLYCLQTTLQVVKTMGIAPQSIVFEVVESDEVKDVDHLVKILAFYRSNGFSVALDDLGAGYSSLNLLSKLKPDFVKLDMELMRNVDHDAYKSVIAAKLLQMAQELNIKTVAEGIETEAEWRWAAEHGVDYAQGYFFAKPGTPPPLIQRRGNGPHELFGQRA